MARALEDYGSWLHAYKEWTVPRSEAPESFILWAGLYTLASVAKRHVKMPARLMGSYEIFPNLFIVFVGPPGGPRKSTTIGYAKTLLGGIDSVEIASTATSTSKLVDLMEDTADGSICIMSSELGSFVNVSQEAMYDFLTDVFDNPESYVYTTREHGYEEIETPTINLLGATTPSWINEQMPPYVIGGGFASRCIFIYEPAPRRRKMYYDDTDKSKGHFDKLQEGLIHDLKHISQLRGSFRHENADLKNEMEEWYVEETSTPARDERLQGYLSRKHLHVHKLAMLLAVAESDELVIRKTHFEIAKTLLGAIEDKMPRVFSSVGKNPYSADLEKVQEYIETKGEVHFSELVARFYHDVGEAELKQIVSTLSTMEYIRVVLNPDGKRKGKWLLAAE